MNAALTRVDFPVRSLIEWITGSAASLTNQAATASPLQNVRLEDLLLSLIDLSVDEAAQIAALVASPQAFARTPERFHEVLQETILRMRLSKLFARTHDRDFHWSVHPAAYDARVGEHHPIEMARWRAEFREMAPERQMMAATLVWMYRGGPDSIWLRRVPCTWKATEALNYMQDAGCLSRWLQLVACYPGW